MDKYATMRYPKRRDMYEMSWPPLPQDFKPKEKKKEQ